MNYCDLYLHSHWHKETARKLQRSPYALCRCEHFIVTTFPNMLRASNHLQNNFPEPLPTSPFVPSKGVFVFKTIFCFFSVIHSLSSSPLGGQEAGRCWAWKEEMHAILHFVLFWALFKHGMKPSSGFGFWSTQPSVQFKFVIKRSSLSLGFPFHYSNSSGGPLWSWGGLLLLFLPNKEIIKSNNLKYLLLTI